MMSMNLKKNTLCNDSAFEQAIEEFMLVEEAGEKFDNEALLNGDLTPVFFWISIG